MLAEVNDELVQRCGSCDVALYGNDNDTQSEGKMVDCSSKSIMSAVDDKLVSRGPGLDLYAHNLGEDNSTVVG